MLKIINFYLIKIFKKVKYLIDNFINIKIFIYFYYFL